MSKYDKYVFRVYQAYNKDLGDGNVERYLKSPYMSRKAESLSTKDIHKPGDIIRESRAKPRVRQDYTLRNENVEGLPHYEYLPHKGISVIGLADPQYSLYRINDIHNKMFARAPNGDLLFNKRLAKALPDAYARLFIKELDRYYNRLEPEDGDYVPSEERKTRIGKSLMDLIQENYNNPVSSNGYIRLGNWDDSPGFHFLTSNLDINERKVRQDLSDFFYNKLISLDGNKVDPNYVYKQSHGGPDYLGMLNSIYQTSEAGNQLWLASVPEDALYKSSDVAARKMRGQRDFPEELVVNRLKLVRPYNVWHKDDMAENQYADGIYEPSEKELNNALIHKLHGFFDKNMDYKRGPNYYGLQAAYNNLTYKKQKDLQKRARDFVFDNFEIDPDEVISDEAKKHIYRDLSSWYDNDRRNRNTVSALTTGDNRWR